MKKIILMTIMTTMALLSESCLINKEDAFMLIKNCTGNTSDINSTEPMYKLVTRAVYEDGRTYEWYLNFVYDDGEELNITTDETGIFEINLKHSVKFRALTEDDIIRGDK